MGEARRRQDLDDTFGKLYDLRSHSVFEKHLSILTCGLVDNFQTEFDLLMFGKVKSYKALEEISDRMEAWLKDKLAIYRESDKDRLVQALVVMINEFSEKNSIGKKGLGHQQKISNMLSSVICRISRRCLSEKAESRYQKFAAEQFAKLT